MTTPGDVAVPLARYAPFRRAGDLVYFAGVVPADPTTGKVVTGFADLPDEVRAQLGETGEMSVDSKDGPILAQSWFVLDGLRRLPTTRPNRVPKPPPPDATTFHEGNPHG